MVTLRVMVEDDMLCRARLGHCVVGGCAEQDRNREQRRKHFPEQILFPARVHAFSSSFSSAIHDITAGDACLDLDQAGSPTGGQIADQCQQMQLTGGRVPNCRMFDWCRAEDRRGFREPALHGQLRKIGGRVMNGSVAKLSATAAFVSPFVPFGIFRALKSARKSIGMRLASLSVNRPKP